VKLTPYGEPVRPIPTTPSWLGVVVGFVVAIGLSLLVAAVLAGVDSSSSLRLIAAVIPIWLGLLAGCAVASQRSGVRLVDSWGLPRTRRGWGKAVLIGAGFGVVIRIASGIAAAPFIPFIDDDDLPFGQVAPLFDLDPAWVWTFAIVAVIGAPLFEEAFFRGVLQSTLPARLGVRGIVLVQGVVFGLAHLEPSRTAVSNAMTVVAISVAGVGFGWLMHWSRTLVTAVVGHATFNAIAVGLLVTYPWLEDFVGDYGAVLARF
jgi:membrane protease YdiL (CAAX protease family)